MLSAKMVGDTNRPYGRTRTYLLVFCLVYIYPAVNTAQNLSKKVKNTSTHAESNPKIATWSNTQLWRDTGGDLLQTGEGNLLVNAPDGLFYLYGNRYRCYPKNVTCFGKVFGTTFSVYSSPDLQAWTLNSSSIFPQMDRGPYNSSHHAYAEPTVLYNRKYGHYVLWFSKWGFAKV